MHRRIPRHSDRKVGKRRGVFADGEDGRALSDESHAGRGTDPQTDTAGGHRLDQTAAAGKVHILNVEPVLFEEP